MVAINYHSCRPLVIVYNPLLATEIIGYDNDKMGREFVVDVPHGSGFISMMGPEALRIKSIFASIFYKETLVKMVPSLFDIFESHFKKISDAIKSGEFKAEYPDGYDSSSKF